MKVAFDFEAVVKRAIVHTAIETAKWLNKRMTDSSLPPVFKPTLVREGHIELIATMHPVTITIDSYRDPKGITWRMTMCVWREVDDDRLKVVIAEADSVLPSSAYESLIAKAKRILTAPEPSEQWIITAYREALNKSCNF